MAPFLCLSDQCSITDTLDSNVNLAMGALVMGLDIKAWLGWMADINLAPLQAQGDAMVSLNDGNNLAVSATGEFFNGQLTMTNQDNVSIAIKIGEEDLTQQLIIDDLKALSITKIMPVLELNVDDARIAGLHWKQDLNRYVMSINDNSLATDQLSQLMANFDAGVVFAMAEGVAAQWLGTLLNSQANTEVVDLLEGFDLSSLMANVESPEEADAAPESPSCGISMSLNPPKINMEVFGTTQSNETIGDVYITGLSLEGTTIAVQGH